jgi:DNA processing protein
MEAIYLNSSAPEFPKQLTEIQNFPKGLYVVGSLPPPETPTLAIVGTRRATPSGKELARTFARMLAEHGFSIISGLAFGIDAAAHEGCLAAGGVTIAVLPCGLDRLYPRSHARLADKILTGGGALVSEYPPKTEALPYRFLERNRIVSGLARGVLIIEAPERSGALATARCAAEQGRDCFVAPGPATHPNYAGAHELIRKGAELVTKPEHILEAYGLLETAPNEAPVKRILANLSAEEALVLRSIQTASGAVDVDKLTDATKLQTQTVNQALTFLLIKGVIKETPDGYMVK